MILDGEGKSPRGSGKDGLLKRQWPEVMSQKVAHPSHSGIQETDLGMIDWTRTDMGFIIALGPNVSDATRSKPGQKMGRVWFGQLQSIIGLIASSNRGKLAITPNAA